MKELRTEIEFEGTPEEVWEVLVDLPSYPEWNPFIVKIDGFGGIPCRCSGSDSGTEARRRGSAP